MKTIHISPDDNVEKIINGLSCPAVVYLGKGVYRQKAEITADNVTIIGKGSETIITNGDFARKIHADGKEYNTFRTYTLCITGNNVRLENLVVENSNTDPATVGQCVALSVHGKFFSAENVELKSTQDTLFLAPFPEDLVVRYRNFIPQNQLYIEGGCVQLFENCRISGSVDFIFGCGEAYFRNCEIISVDDGREIGFVAAPAHSLAQEYGFNFINCKFIGAGGKTVYLARPWRDFGKCAFIGCELGSHVTPELFDKWNDTARDRTARFLYSGLKSDIRLSPAVWSKELTAVQVNDIINRRNKKFNNINK